MVGTHIYQNESVDYPRLLAIGALFKGVFSIDWLLDLFAEDDLRQLHVTVELRLPVTVDYTDVHLSCV